jgi:hypothetical protein
MQPRVIFSFFLVLNFPFPPANFGSIVNVVLEYVGNRRPDKPAGGVERTCLIPALAVAVGFFIPLFYLTFSHLSVVRLTNNNNIRN